MKTKIISKVLVTFGLVFVLGSTITQVHSQGIATIHSTGDVTRGETGSFVVDYRGTLFWGGTYVNFSVNGTAIPGVDYAALISPVRIDRARPCNICQNWYYGVIPIKTLPDLRGSFFPQAYSVVVTLEPGLGYAMGEPSSAQLMINP
jgi:hypothetical protein